MADSLDTNNDTLNVIEVGTFQQMQRSLRILFWSRRLNSLDYHEGFQICSVLMNQLHMVFPHLVLVQSMESANSEGNLFRRSESNRRKLISILIKIGKKKYGIW